uniref:Protein tweety homolog n=1 Tax=Anopheles maculatus TaxID=74869 RepID=A0A182T330_9DIPT
KKLTASSATLSDKDPRDISNNGFNRFDPKYVSIGPKAIRNTVNNVTANVNKCATLRHGGRYGGSLSVSAGMGGVGGGHHAVAGLGGARSGTSPSPNLKNVQQPMLSQSQTQQYKQHHQDRQLSSSGTTSIMTVDGGSDRTEQKLAISTVSKEYSQQSYSCATLPYKKPGSGYTETTTAPATVTTSILKKESNLDNQHNQRYAPTVYSIDTSAYHHQREGSGGGFHHHSQPSHHQQSLTQQTQQLQQYQQQQQQQQQQQTHHRSLSSTNQLYQETGAGSVFASPPPSIASTATTRSNVSIINQPLPDIPTGAGGGSSNTASNSIKNSQQPLCAATLNQYRSLQRPHKQHTGSSSGLSALTTSAGLGKPTIPPKVTPPMLPPKNRHKDESQYQSKMAAMASTGSGGSIVTPPLPSSRPQQPLPQPPPPPPAQSLHHHHSQAGAQQAKSSYGGTGGMSISSNFNAIQQQLQNQLHFKQYHQLTQQPWQREQLPQQSGSNVSVTNSGGTFANYDRQQAGLSSSSRNRSYSGGSSSIDQPLPHPKPSNIEKAKSHHHSSSAAAPVPSGGGSMVANYQTLPKNHHHQQQQQQQQQHQQHQQQQQQQQQYLQQGQSSSFGSTSSAGQHQPQPKSILSKTRPNETREREQREREREQRERDRERDRDHHRERDRDHRDRDRDRDRERDRDRDRDRERDRDRDRDKDRDRDRERDRHHDRDRERNRDREHRERDRERDRDREHHRDRDREREKEQDRTERSHHHRTSHEYHHDSSHGTQPSSKNPNVYYRSLQRGGLQANNDLYSVTEL